MNANTRYLLASLRGVSDIQRTFTEQLSEFDARSAEVAFEARAGRVLGYCRVEAVSPQSVPSCMDFAE